MNTSPVCPRCKSRLFIEDGEDGRSWHCPCCGYDKPFPRDMAEVRRTHPGAAGIISTAGAAGDEGKASQEEDAVSKIASGRGGGSYYEDGRRE